MFEIVEEVPGFKVTKYKPGSAMGYDDAELRSLHDVAEAERKRQQKEKNDIEKKRQEIIQFLKSFRDIAREIISIGHNEVIDQGDGTFLKIQKGPGFVYFAITTDQWSNIHQGSDHLDPEKVSILVSYSTQTYQNESVEVFDRNALQKIIDGGKRSESVTMWIKNMETDSSLTGLSSEELEQLVALLPFKPEDLNKAIKES